MCQINMEVAISRGQVDPLEMKVIQNATLQTEREEEREDKKKSNEYN